jgi:phytoene/squalene synthetase
MKQLFDKLSRNASVSVTRMYSTSFYAGVRCLDKAIQGDIHAIYGFVRFADEIVDSFHGYDKEILLREFKEETFTAIERGIALNPILNSFQECVRKYMIDLKLIEQFFHSMEMDLSKIEYNEETYKEYILGSAEVVGLMCLKVFVYGNKAEYDRLTPYAMKLGSAFQKINFLRDLKDDVNGLGRMYFPHISSTDHITLEEKLAIEEEIEEEFVEAYKGIIQLPKSSRFGVYLSYIYYTKLLRRIKRKTVSELMQQRISISNNTKVFLFCQSYVRNSINLI